MHWDGVKHECDGKLIVVRGFYVACLSSWAAGGLGQLCFNYGSIYVPLGGAKPWVREQIGCGVW